MKIKNLSIKKFRAVENVEYDFSKVNVFKGKNALGKSTIIDSIIWMLTDTTLVNGKDNKKNVDLRDIKKPIEASLVIEDKGVEYTLNRRYYANYKLDTNGEEVFSEYKNEFRINGNKFTVEKYLQAVRDMVGVGDSVKGFNELQFLYDTNYLEKIDYKIARSYILGLITIPTDAEILSKDKYEPIRNDILTMAQLKKCDGLDTVFTLISKYNENIRKAQATQEVKEKELAGLDKNVTFDLEKIENLQSELRSLSSKSADTSMIDNKIETLNKTLRNDLNRYNMVYSRYKEDLNDNKNACLKLENKIKTYEQNASHCKKEILELESKKDSKRIRLQQVEKKICDLKESFAGVQSSSKDQLEVLHFELKNIQDKEYKSANICPNCGYELDPASAQTQKEKDLAYKRNEIVSLKELASLKENFFKEELHALEISKSNIEKESYENVEEFKLLLMDINENLEDCTNELNYCKEARTKILEPVKNDYVDTQKVNVLLEDLKQAKQKIINDFKQKSVERYDCLEEQLAQENAKMQAFEYIQKIKDEIKKAKLDQVGNLQLKQLVSSYKKDKQQAIEEAVGQVFDTVHFVLQKENETGTIVDCCTPVLNGVDFSGLNSGQKYITGLEVIESVRKAKGYADFPIFIDRLTDLDNENQNKLSEMTSSQLVFTEVNNDEKLTFEAK